MLDNRLPDAIKRVCQDKQNKFDECLVEQLFKYTSDQRFKHFRPTLSDLYSVDNFVVYNQARIIKFHLFTLGADIESNMKDTNNIFWKRLPLVIKENETKTVTATLSLLVHIANDKNGYLWLMDKKFKRPVKMPAPTSSRATGAITGPSLPEPEENAGEQYVELEDAASIARFYMETRKNYHIQNLARRLFVHLIGQSCRHRISPLHRLVVVTRNIIEELIRTRSPVIFIAMPEILNDILLLIAANERYNLSTLTKMLFDETPVSNTSEFMSICKCLALTSVPKESFYPIDRLRSAGNLEAIVTYVCNFRGQLFDQSLMIYIIYPILASCDSENAQILVPKLFITREDKDFINRHMNDKSVMMCIFFIAKLLKMKLNTQLITFNSYVPHNKTTMFHLKVMTEYIACNHSSSKAYKNIMECCSVLRNVRSFIKRPTDTVWLFELIDTCIEIVRKIDCSNPRNKTILMEMVRITRDAQHEVFSLTIDKVNKNINDMIELAFTFEDIDVLDEFTEYFGINQPPLMMSCSKIRRYVDLVWNHLRVKAQNSDHREMLGHVILLLIPIDLVVDETMLATLDIRKYHDIPMLIGNTLIDYSYVIPIVELIIDDLYVRSEVIPIKGYYNFTTADYLKDLDCNNFANSVKDCLDHVIRGLCLTVKGEASVTTRKNALDLIYKLVEKFIANSDDAKYLMVRLVKTGILETIYEVATGSMYSQDFNFAEISLIKDIAKKLEAKQREELIASLAGLNPNKSLLERATKVMSFYISNESTHRINQPDNDNVSLKSFLDDIFDEQRISKGISECY